MCFEIGFERGLGRLSEHLPAARTRGTRLRRLRRGRGGDGNAQEASPRPRHRFQGSPLPTGLQASPRPPTPARRLRRRFGRKRNRGVSLRDVPILRGGEHRTGPGTSAVRQGGFTLRVLRPHTPMPLLLSHPGRLPLCPRCPLPAAGFIVSFHKHVLGLALF